MPEVNTPVLDVLVKTNEGMLERSGLDAETFVLAHASPRWPSTGAPPESYLLNLGAAVEIGGSVEQVEGVLIAIAPRDRNRPCGP